MDSTISALTERLEKFFESIRTHPIQIVSSSVIVALVLYIGVNTGFAELVRQNAHRIHMLACEPLTESGPDLIEANTEHAEMVQVYVEHMQQSNLAAILGLLYPECSLKNQLDSVWLPLTNAPVDDERVREVNCVAGKQINGLCERAEELSRRPIIWFTSKYTPDEMLRDTDNMLPKSQELVGTFEKELLVENAPEACEDNRRTMLLLFMARLSYNINSQKRFLDSFRRIVETYVKRKEELTRKFGEGSAQKELLMIFGGSEERRLTILEAMSANDMDQVCVCVIFSLC